MDVLTPEQRAYCMSRIQGRNTKPEQALRKALWALGYRYRIQSKLTGKPDIVFPRHRLAVFVDGCFWHRCPDHFVTPKTRTEFWMKKIERNVERDHEVTHILEEQGWLVLRFWEHQIKNDLSNCAAQVIHHLAPPLSEC